MFSLYIVAMFYFSYVRNYRYKGINKEQLQKTLYDCNGLLMQSSHVNRKVFDQYVILMEEHEELKKKRAELDASDHVSSISV